MADLKRSAAAWAVGICDAHCHPTDISSSTSKIADMKAKVLTVMATRAQDQDLVEDLANRYPCKGREQMFDRQESRHVIPSFGWHPWFTYQVWDDRDGADEQFDYRSHLRSVLVPVPDDDKFLDSLPPPLRLTEHLRQTEARLKRHPLALVGEVGLDRSFRVPFGPYRSPPDPELKYGHSNEVHTAGSRDGRPLSPHRVSMEHQKMVLKAQLELAAKYGRAVSVHSVAAHGVVFEMLQSLWQGHERPSKSAMKRKKKDTLYTPVDDMDDLSSDTSPNPYPSRVCMHSYSGPPEALKQYLAPTVPAEIYFSFSSLINFSGKTDDKSIQVIRLLPDDKVLIESDLHCAGYEMDRLLDQILRKVCSIKGWGLEEGARILRQNWEDFVFGKNGNLASNHNQT